MTSIRRITARDQLPRRDTRHTCEGVPVVHPENQAGAGEVISHRDCACQTPGHLSCSDLGRAQNSGPTESGPLRSTQVPGKSHGWRSLVGCSPWGCEESDTTERLHFHFSLSCIGEGNGNPLLCSCLENPRVREAWWAAVSEVAQSRTRLKRLSSKCLKLSGLDLEVHTTQGQPQTVSGRAI